MPRLPPVIITTRIRSPGSSKRDGGREMHARRAADAVRDDQREPDDRRGEPYAAADAPVEVLVREPRAIRIDGGRVEKPVDADFSDVERRRQGQAELHAGADERITDRAPGTEATQVRGAAE